MFDEFVDNTERYEEFIEELLEANREGRFDDVFNRAYGMGTFSIDELIDIYARVDNDCVTNYRSKNESEEAVSESESSSNEASKNETVSEAASSEKETDGALSQSASSQNASAPEADSQNTVEKIIDQLKNDPYTLRIVLIAAIIIIGIWLCVFIALRRKKNAQKNEDSNGASNSSEETLEKAKRADMFDSKDSDNGFADPDKNKDEK